MRHKLSNGGSQESILSRNLLIILMAQLSARPPSKTRIPLHEDGICMGIPGRNWNYLQRQLKPAVQVTGKFLKECGLDIAPEKSAVLAFTDKSVPIS